MNKFILFALVAASVALAVATPVPQEDDFDNESSELSIYPENDEETAALKGTNLEQFAPFCTQTRDDVLRDIQQKGNLFASGMFGSLFRSFGDVAQTSVDASNKASEILSSQLANPSSPINGASQSEIDALIEKTQEEIQNAGNQGESLYKAFLGGITAFGQAGYSKVVSKIDDFTKKASAISVGENLVNLCKQLTAYEEVAKQIFKEVKEGLVAENPEQYKNVQYSEVAPKCVTANRLSRAEGFCQFVQRTKVPISKILGYGEPKTNADQ